MSVGAGADEMLKPENSRCPLMRARVVKECERYEKRRKGVEIAYLPQPEQEQLPEEQVQELEEPEQPQSPFILMVGFFFLDVVLRRRLLSAGKQR